MSGIIRLSGPVPSVETDDINIDISTEDNDSAFDLQTPQPSPIKPQHNDKQTNDHDNEGKPTNGNSNSNDNSNDNHNDTELMPATNDRKHKNGFSRIPTRSFRNLKSPFSAESPSDEDEEEDEDSHSHCHSHGDDSPYLPTFHGLKACYPLMTYKNDIKSVSREIIAGMIVSFAQVPGLYDEQIPNSKFQNSYISNSRNFAICV